MRKLRRSRFAAPIVITFAAAGCAATPPPAPVQPEQPHGNPPPARVEKQPDGTCVAVHPIPVCTPPTKCDPGPPDRVPCP